MVKETRKIPFNLRVNNWIQEFGMALLQCFELGFFRDASNSSVASAATGLMNATKVAGKARLIDSFEMFLKSILELFHAQEAIKIADLSINA